MIFKDSKPAQAHPSPPKPTYGHLGTQAYKDLKWIYKD